MAIDTSGGDVALAPDAPAAALMLQVDPSLPKWLEPRLKELVAAATSLPVETLDPQASLPPLGPGSLVLSVGETRLTQRLVPPQDAQRQALRPGGALVRSGQEHGVTVLVATGLAQPEPFGTTTNVGALYAAFAALEELGFAFLHPLDPLVPEELSMPASPLSWAGSPRWPVRTLHIHTQHPLELTNVLNGWGIQGHEDQVGFEAMTKEWHLVCQWLLANRQNAVEWALLWAEEWADFADSELRQQRLASLVDIAHQYGIAVGISAGIALAQQHNFRLIREEGALEDELAQIRQRADYLMAAGFDFMGTENGTSEFTSPDDQRMLAWMNELATHVHDTYGKPVHIKVHCSRGQTAPNFPDPVTGEPINFNFLPHYAVPELGVMPHTVQIYALDDPAPTYANEGFDYIRQFMRQQAGSREVLWFPETAYWVSYDVDVPLFLPVYAQRRLHDLRLIAQDEQAGLTGRGPHQGSPIQGQVIFSSGWEWGYWLNDVITARGAFDPLVAAASTEEAFQTALEPVVRPFGAAATRLRHALARIAQEQHELLVLGLVNGTPPAEITKRNGQAYLQGWETFDDVGTLISGIPGLPALQTQPAKLGLVDLRYGTGGVSYTELRPLLAAMETQLSQHLELLQELAPDVPRAAEPIYRELVHGAEINALRARQVLALYDYVDDLDLWGGSSALGLTRLKAAQEALDQAQHVVQERERAYRVPADRIAGWHVNPTAYPFGFLWPARTLHYWWRDEGKAIERPLSPCYLNVLDPAGIAFGEGFWVDSADTIQTVLEAVGLGSAVGDCLTGPHEEPSYPPPGVR